jgi:hypothetical protein
MKNHRLSLVVGLTMAFAALALAGFQSSLVPTATAAAKTATRHESRSKAAPRSVAKAQGLARLAVTQLVRNYAKGRAKSVCSGLTAKTRKLLGGAAKCAAIVRLTRRSTPISKATIKKVVVQSGHSLAIVSGYLNGNRKQRLTVVLKWESGHYRLDRSVSALSGVLR